MRKQDVGNLKKLYCQELGDSCAQNKTPEISKNALARNMGLLCAEQNAGNLKHAFSRILGLLCAEQNVRNLKNCTFKNSGTPGRRTTRQKSQKTDFQEFWDSFSLDPHPHHPHPPLATTLIEAPPPTPPPRHDP